MSRRRRAILMLAAALAAGLLAVTLVGGYSSSVAETYGALRPVVVLARGIESGRAISPEAASKSLRLRRIPARFVPTAALEDPSQAIGLELAAPLPAGSYLTGSVLQPPGEGKKKAPSAGRGRHAVEISVAGAGALTGSGKVDVLITSDDNRGGGRTRVAARKVPLLAIGRTGQSESGPGLTEVTLALTRPQALRLVDAEAFARRITILPPAGG